MFSLKMNIQILLLLFFSALLLSKGQDLNWSCEANVTGQHIDISRMAGEWYEVARIPSADVPACVKVLAPASVNESSDSYELQVNYINNVNKNWQAEAENLSFPWTNAAEKGLFELTYGTGAISVSLEFKLAFTDYEDVAVVCWYASMASTATLGKVLSRRQNVSVAVQNAVTQLASQLNVTADIGWVYQGARCNSAVSVQISLLLAYLYGLYLLL